MGLICRISALGLEFGERDNPSNFLRALLALGVLSSIRPFTSMQ
jgi:hypothetical protein